MGRIRNQGQSRGPQKSFDIVERMHYGQTTGKVTGEIGAILTKEINDVVVDQAGKDPRT